MPPLPAIADLSLELIYNHLVFLPSTNHRGNDLSSSDGRLAHGYVIAVSHQKDLIQLNRISLYRQLLYLDSLPGGDFILLPASLNYSVNLLPPENSILEDDTNSILDCQAEPSLDTDLLFY
jgi:hypothetical protein